MHRGFVIHHSFHGPAVSSVESSAKVVLELIRVNNSIRLIRGSKECFYSWHSQTDTAIRKCKLSLIIAEILNAFSYWPKRETGEQGCVQGGTAPEAVFIVEFDLVPLMTFTVIQRKSLCCICLILLYR